ncbi:MAG: (2Fe-2S) ferredoxin domain-containing protein, partial [Nitrospinaceae bacterium]|nr:(2Fe-2S) ferredoxin domain-containing protein [Nitrospinaceae bacterium]
MPKLRIEDLERIVESQKKATSLREGAGRAKITVHMGTCGISAGARKIMAEIMRCIQEAGVNDVLVTTSGCAGLCSREPMVTVEVLGQAPVK